MAEIKDFSKKIKFGFFRKTLEKWAQWAQQAIRVPGPPYNPALCDLHQNHKKNNSQTQSANILYHQKTETKAIHTHNQLVTYHIETIVLGLPYEGS